MKRNSSLIAWAFALPFILLLNACKKDNLSDIDRELSEKSIANVAISGNKLPVTKISGVVNPVDIQFDYDGNLYILTPKCIKTLTNGKLKTLSLPDTVFTDFSAYWDGWVYGPAKHIAADRNGTIYLAQREGIRIIYKNGRVDTFVNGDIGWGVSDLRDLAVTSNGHLFYCSYDGIVRAVPEAIQTPTNFFGNGLYPYSDWSAVSILAMDCGDNNIAWLGTNKGIASFLLPENPDYNEGYEFKINYLGDPDGKKSEGPIEKVKLGDISQIEATDDGSVICFIEGGNLKQLRKGIVKIITPMANNTRIALSKDADKLYFISNGDLNVLDL
jgi:hypothetical protein